MRTGPSPFVPGTPVLSDKRDYRLRVVPDGTDLSTVDASLQDVPEANVLSSPTKGSSFVLANRVYNAFPGYNQGGAAGPTDTPLPPVRAVDLATGEGVDCSSLNLVPRPAAPTDMPTSRGAPAGNVTLTDGSAFGVGPDGGSTGTGAEYAPALDPAFVEFTRPPLLPGADVSSVPPADDCAGYLGAATSTTQIGLIRVPQVPTWFDTTQLTPETTFVQEQTTYVSLTKYGASTGSYEPGRPTTASPGNEELLVDASGGATVVVWPRSLSDSQQQQVLDLARRQGWALLRGGEQGKVATANLFLRMKGTSPDYQGGFVPTSQRPGVPCYFDDHPDATSWARSPATRTSPARAASAARPPRGCNCTLEAYLDGTCLTTLKSHIASTGSSYAP